MTIRYEGENSLTYFVHCTSHDGPHNLLPFNVNANKEQAERVAEEHEKKQMDSMTL